VPSQGELAATFAPGWRGFRAPPAASLRSCRRCSASQLVGQARRGGERVSDQRHHLLIVATALRHKLMLVTRYTRHFTRVPGLRLH
jgi:hypothetical protein